ncbi:ABC-type sodium efflux pump system, ATPase component [Thermococcus kodakarensis KOD1]|uniref:ABC-type sodium efflux pump system, ATPase component n=1 Tax=Thermococcus kodakarensis (strain ATCC BAA-918 / JCM 12380 / KOD1) TaxID=69014 RepID=Q5JGV1_THEKO|nr:ABC transporter ATP-binding protein [Thermococcus kodakarensis]WCN27317.1 ABC transporter ATP-binding protein [Thermococcus kodakarensis]WCN29605.1 ABC transporter ATP-binding protein [Thermococcus kodakarensis]BAD85526.1 ABC-type sodium efflux pump system, ATPase component [Thermococcus kodakarensis KOD1]
MKAVLVEGLEKDYGKVKALKGISFEIKEGEIFGLIGPNGAGKSTTLKILATLLRPTGGKAEVFGHDVVEEAEEVRALISYLPEEAGAYKNLTGLEYLRFMARLYAKDEKKAEEMVKRGVQIAGLGDRLRDKVSTYSKGMTRKLLLARALMVMPKLAILDEPASGLDIVNAYTIRKTIKSFAREEGVTFLVSSHNMLEVEFLCDRVALINEGRIVESGTPAELKEKYDAENLEEVFMRAVGVEIPEPVGGEGS